MAMDGEWTFMHMLQGFLVDTTKRIRSTLPQEVVILDQGRTIVRGLWNQREFGVRVFFKQNPDDIWPSLHAILDIQGLNGDLEIDVHPDKTPTEHAEVIVQTLKEHLESHPSEVQEKRP